MALVFDNKTSGTFTVTNTPSTVFTHTVGAVANPVVVLAVFGNFGLVSLFVGGNFVPRQGGTSSIQPNYYYYILPSAPTGLITFTGVSSIGGGGQGGFYTIYSYSGSSATQPDAIADVQTGAVNPNTVHQNITTVLPNSLVWSAASTGQSQVIGTTVGMANNQIFSAPTGTLIGFVSGDNGISSAGGTTVTAGFTASGPSSSTVDVVSISIAALPDPLSINVSDSTTVSTSFVGGVINVKGFNVTDSTAVTDGGISFIIHTTTFTFFDLTATLVTSAYKWLTTTLTNAQQSFTVRPYFNLKILDDTVQPNAILTPSTVNPLANGALASCPDGSVVAVGFDSSNNISFWKAANLHASAGVWDSTTVLDAAAVAFENGQNRVDVAVSDYINGSYQIDVYYFGNFVNSSSNVTIIWQSSTDGGVTWTKRTLTPGGMQSNYYTQPAGTSTFVRNLCLAAMKPRWNGANIQSGVLYIKPFTSAINGVYAGYDIYYTTYLNGTTTLDIKWSPRYIDSSDWTIHSLTSCYLNGTDIVIFSGFRNFVDPPNTVYNSVLINGVSAGATSGDYVGGNYGLWATSIESLTGATAMDVWSPPQQVINSLGVTFTNQNEFVFPVANISKGTINLLCRALTVNSVSTGASGATSQTVTTTLNYMLMTSVDGVNFTYPTPLVYSDGTVYNDTGLVQAQTWVSYVAQGSYFYTGGGGKMWEFIQNATVADVTSNVLNYSIQEAAGQPSSINVVIGNANAQWLGTSPTGTGASAIAGNRKILLSQGYYNASGSPETVPRNVYFIDDIEQTVTGSQNTITLIGRDLYKKLVTLQTKYSLGRVGPYFYTDIFDGSTLTNWNQVSGTWNENVINSGIQVNNTLATVSAPTDSVIVLNATTTPQWGSQMVVFVGRNVGGTTYVYAMYIDSENWLRIEFVDTSTWTVAYSTTSLGRTVYDTGSYGLNNGYTALLIRQYDYYKFNFIIGNGGSGNVIGAWSGSIPFGFGSTSGGEFDMTPYIPTEVSTVWTVGLGGNGGSNAASVGSTYGASFQYFSYAQFQNPNNVADLVTWMGNKAGITSYNFQQSLYEYFYTPSNYSGTFTMPNRTLRITASNGAMNNISTNQLSNSEVQFVASLASSSTLGFSFIFRANNPTYASVTGAYYLHVYATSGGAFVGARFERLYSGTQYIFPSSTNDTTSEQLALGSLNFNLTNSNTYRVVFSNGWMYAYINNVMVCAYNDSNTTSAYLTSGYWGFQADANTTLTVKNVLVPVFWKTTPAFSYNPGDDIQSGTDSVTQSIQTWYFSDLFGVFKAVQLNHSDPSSYTYNPLLYSQGVDNSNKEYISEVTVYGLNVIATATATNLMAGALIRPMVIVDYTILTQQDAQTRANNELINANQYQNQYSPIQSMNVGAEIFDVVTVVNTGSNTSGVNTPTRTYAQTLTEGGAASAYSIELDTGNE